MNLNHGGAKQYFEEVQIRVEDNIGRQGRRIGFARSMDDANLIAAAPEMYRVLKELLDDNKLVYGDDYDLVHDLLAKVSGNEITS